MEPFRSRRELTDVSGTSGAPTDEALWAAASAGDGPAFRAIFDRHADAVLTQCTRRTGSRADSEDLTSTVFLEAWRSRARVRFVNGSIRPWLLVIASNVARKHVRTSNRYAARLRRLPPELPSTDCVDETVDRVDAQRRGVMLARHLAGMSEKYSAVVGLCDLAGLSYSEAAEALNVPVGTVRSRLSRAHAKLRGLLEDPAPAVVGDLAPTLQDPTDEVR